MSTLQCTNLQDTSGGNSLTTAQIYNGAAKAWVNFNGTGTVAIRAQFNVSSITDNGTGDYTVTFTTAMADANYAVANSASWDSPTRPGWMGISSGQAPSSSSVRMLALRPSDYVAIDVLYATIAIFR